MAKNEPNKPDEIKTEPAKELQMEEKNMPGTEPTAEKTAMAHDGAEQPQAPAQSDIAADKAIPSDKSVSEQQAVKAVEKSAEDKKEPEAPTTEDKTPEKKRYARAASLLIRP